MRGEGREGEEGGRGDRVIIHTLEAPAYIYMYIHVVHLAR